MPVYAVRWNALHPRAFLSAAADWSVKVWDSMLPQVGGWGRGEGMGRGSGRRTHAWIQRAIMRPGRSPSPLPAAPAPHAPTHTQPVLSFDLGASAGDAAWAPFSSTVLAAVSEAGRVHVFDVAQNRHAALCAQRMPTRGALTRLAFNPLHPVLLVGDEHGAVTCLKLSPNLRAGATPGLLPPSSSAAPAPAAAPAAERPAGGHAEAKLARSESQLSAARAAEAARLEGVLELAGKCNAALLPEDWELV